MKLSARVGQLITLSLFTLLCAGIFSYLWVNSGGRIPGVSKTDYQVTISFPRVANLVYFGDVMIAGVKVGKVDSVTPVGNHAQVVIDLNTNYPLHQGVTAQIRAKSLVEENFIELTDGTGPSIPNGSVLPSGVGHAPTELNDVLLALSGQTRDALASEMRSLGAATDGSKVSISNAMQGLGELGRGGYTALDALNAQTDALRAVTGHTAQMLAALDTDRGEIAQLVDSSNELFSASADAQGDLKQTMRALPPVLNSARNACDSLTELGGSLAPVARNLRDAGPDLSDALQELRPSSRNLRALTPDLDEALRKAHGALERVHQTSMDLNDLSPQAQGDLADLNPILGYLEPYGKDIGGMLANFADALNHGDNNVNYFSVEVGAGLQSVMGNPVNRGVGPLNVYTPYMAPFGGANPRGGPGIPYKRLNKDHAGR